MSLLFLQENRALALACKAPSAIVLIAILLPCPCARRVIPHRIAQPEFGPKAPTTLKGLLGFLHARRVRGYAMIDEVFTRGMTAMAAPVFRRREIIGVISIAGPRTRLDSARMHELAPALPDAATQFGPISNASTLFGRPPLGKG